MAWGLLSFWRSILAGRSLDSISSVINLCDVNTKTIFLSHEATFKDQAVTLKGILGGTAKEPTQIYLSSDWESLEAGVPWFEPLIKAIKESAAFITIIPRPGSSFNNLWINFEIGLAMGCGKKPKVFVFGGVEWSQLEYPLKGIHLIDTGDTNRLNWRGIEVL